MDIQRFLDGFFTANNIKFVPGTKAVQNLFENTSVIMPNQLYFFCDPIQRQVKRSRDGSYTGQKATINFAFVTNSDLDMPYMNENVNTVNKYTNNIEPIINKWNLFVKKLACTLTVTNESYTDIINIKDVNFDGLIGQITLETYD